MAGGAGMHAARPRRCTPTPRDLTPRRCTTAPGASTPRRRWKHTPPPPPECPHHGTPHGGAGNHAAGAAGVPRRRRSYGPAGTHRPHASTPRHRRALTMTGGRASPRKGPFCPDTAPAVRYRPTECPAQGRQSPAAALLPPPVVQGAPPPGASPRKGLFCPRCRAPPAVTQGKPPHERAAAFHLPPGDNPCGEPVPHGASFV